MENKKDYIVRGTAANGQIRCFAITSKNLVEEARNRHQTSPVITAALGRLLSGGAMMGAMMKGEKDLLTLQIQCSGPVQGLTVTADAFGHVKGYAVNPVVSLPARKDGKLDVGGALDLGILTVIKDIGMKETGILVSCSDYHIFYKMKMTRREAMEHYLNIIRDCLEIGVSPRCHLEDITRADIYGYVIPFCLELMRLMEFYQIPIKVRCCDTMGYGVNYPGAVIPRSVPGIIYGIMTHAGVPSELIEWHGHNDFYKAVTNSTTAWLYGASGVNCSLFGIGERTGNTPLEAMVFEYAQLRGTLDGMDTRVITELAEYYEKEIGYRVPSRTPFVGENFNVTRAGIHADGLLKNEEIYNIFDTDKFLNRPVLVAVSNTSGLAGIAHWINTYYHLPEEDKISKDTPLVKMVKEWVDREYESGRVTILTNQELVTVISDSCKKLNIPLPGRKEASTARKTVPGSEL